MHFTYTEVDPEQLRQGDVVRRTSEIEEVLRSVHPHYYSSADYRHFIVITQSCDLVRRQGAACSSRYISIAAVRPLQLAVDRFAEGLQYSEIDRRLGIADSRRKSKLEQFVERLLNNNEDDYFFLYRSPESGLTEDACAFLKLSIALKSDLHYDTLLSGKILQLTEAFQHKLGHLVGRSYSRVGTEDWPRDKAYYELRNSAVKSVELNWIDGPIYNRVTKDLDRLPADEQTLEKLLDLISQISSTAEANRNDLLESMRDALKGVGIDDAKINDAIRRFENRPVFKKLVK